MPGGSKGGNASDQEDAQTSEAWAEGISWHMLVTELDTLQVAAEFDERGVGRTAQSASEDQAEQMLAAIGHVVHHSLDKQAEMWPLGQGLSQEAGGMGQSESIRARIVIANTGAEAGKDNATTGAKGVPDDTGFTIVPHKARSSLKDAEVRKGANNAQSPNRFQLLDTPLSKDIDEPQDETMQEGEISASEAENPVS
ncbi:hypothetical protein R1sor_011906 [Riccia sorocarpa]|uniref:Uncharacterized protein n=1 Tax=Riccia sorocarpa TaxID=122646 RepID=A0ABD3I291_9MARC